MKDDRGGIVATSPAKAVSLSVELVVAPSLSGAIRTPAEEMAA